LRVSFADTMVVVERFIFKVSWGISRGHTPSCSRFHKLYFPTGKSAIRLQG
jgi:hypothetical protein